MEISESLVFVQANETAYIGDKVRVRFSFPGLIEPFTLETQVVAKQLAAGPGRPGGWTLGFVFYSDEEQNQLRSLLTRADPTLAKPPQTPYRVLLVEDNDITREAFELAIERNFGAASGSVAVDIVDNGEEAWKRLTSEHYDLAIVDYFLPALNGDRLISRLRQEPALSRLPVVAISVGGSEIKQASLDAGADLFLHKPIVLRDLFATLQRLTAARTQSSSFVDRAPTTWRASYAGTG
nr:response regulator [Haliangium ochraceum]